MIQRTHVGMVALFAVLTGIHTKNPRTKPGELTTRIIGGVKVKQSVYPFMVGIFYSGLLKCGGSIISAYFIMTASHCCYYNLRSLNENMIRLSMGNVYWRNGTSYKVKKIFMHPEYTPGHEYNDIALLQTKVRITFGPSVNAVKINPNQIGNLKRITATVIGWGFFKIKKKFSHGLSDYLLSVQLNSIPSEECAKYWTDLRSSQICMKGMGERLACVGDSGGPLVMQVSRQIMQIGIVSFGDEDCENIHADVYTRVSSYYFWIRNITKRQTRRKLYDFAEYT